MKNPPYPIRRILVPSRKHYRNKISIFLLCAAISFFMWGLIKLSRVYEAPVKYRINYQNLPSDKVLVSAGDTVLTLYIKARGLELYGRMLNPRKNIINISLSGLKLHRDGHKYYGYLRTSKILKDISSQIPQDNNLSGVEPDTIRFVFEQEYRKRVPIHADVSLSFAEQYQLLDSIVLSPDSVTLFGIRSVIDTFYKINTEPYSLRNLKSSRMLTLKLIKPAAKIPVALSTDTITAEINVERFTEAKIEVPVSDVIDEKRIYRTFPDKVNLTIRIAMREYERLDPSLFSVSINYSDAILKGTNIAEVIITRQPPFAKVINIEPAKVEFLILK
ncbi:MAG TPA: YbbR-like domain-containing protein [Lentimicrobium sp.]|nr:YbbR-like domain-containing protein [Lentimicrobium sp.]